MIYDPVDRRADEQKTQTRQEEWIWEMYNGNICK